MGLGATYRRANGEPGASVRLLLFSLFHLVTFSQTNWYKSNMDIIRYRW